MADRGQVYLDGAAARIAKYSEDCTRCGACFDACPMPGPAGIGEADSGAAVGGLFDLLAGGAPSKDSETWTSVCCGSGYCKSACPEGIDVRFLQRMGKVALLQRDGDPRELKRRSVSTFNTLSGHTRAITNVMTTPEELQRLNATPAAESATPDVVFYTGCNVWKTPHIVLTALDAFDALDVSVRVMGGPSMCCGVHGFNVGDAKISGRQAFGAIENIAKTGVTEALSWCPSCQIQIGDLALGNWQEEKGETPFELAPFYGFLAGRIDDLKPHLKAIPPRRVALIERPAIPGAMEAVKIILSAIPGVEMVDLDVRPAGVMENSLAVLKSFRSSQRTALLAGAEAAGVDVLGTIYHSCHRELCLYDDGKPFEIMNVMSLVAESLGNGREDRYKELKALGSPEAVIAAVAPDAEARGLDVAAIRSALILDMFPGAPLAPPPSQ